MCLFLLRYLLGRPLLGPLPGPLGSLVPLLHELDLFGCEFGLVFLAG